MGCCGAFYRKICTGEHVSLAYLYLLYKRFIGRFRPKKPRPVVKDRIVIGLEIQSSP